MKKTDAIRAITKAYSTLKDIETERDLQKNKLSLNDYFAARDIFSELSTPGSSAKTFITSVADFYKRSGFNVTLAGVNYIITTA